MSIEVYKTPRDRGEDAADDAMNILYTLLNRVSQERVGVVKEKFGPNGRASIDDLYGLNPSHELYEKDREAALNLAECICSDWENKAKIRVLGIPVDSRKFYIGRMESKLNELILKRDLNKYSGEGPAYMRDMLKKSADSIMKTCLSSYSGFLPQVSPEVDEPFEELLKIVQTSYDPSAK